VTDDGSGLNKEKILQKAQANGLLRKAPGDYTDKEIYQFIFMPGFSTTEAVTNYSGRGVGMDVVSKNMEAVQGVTSVDSIPGEGSVITMKIPLTLAIIKGMTIRMGGEKFTVPIDAISNSFPPKKSDMFIDPNGNEMITVYGEHLNVVKLYEFFEVHEAAKDIEDGLMMIVTNGDDRICLFIDELVAEQSVVVKNLPKYMKKIPGISGCTLLGNGDISLIIETAAFFDR
jgi:two-component system chemotaxis sensor kinase CheA